MSDVPQPPQAPPSFLDGSSFSVLCEIEPPRKPDIQHVRTQIDALNPVVDAFLIPDNHLGRATVSSVAVAHEVAAVGGRSIACLNARDRNLLGFRRDLLTAAAYGVSEFLFVYGDDPAAGQRTGQLTVREMLHETRTFGAQPSVGGPAGFRAGAATRLGKVPAWKLQADFLFVQISFEIDELLRWRDTIQFDG